MLYITLETYYETIHVMHTKMNYSLEDIFNMYPYERDIFILMSTRDMEKEIQRAEKTKGRFHGKLPF